MHGLRLRQFLDARFPEIPETRREGFRAYQRLLARRIAVVVAVAVLLMLPAFQLVDYLLYDHGRTISDRNAVWRLPVMILALSILVLRWRLPENDWPRPMILLLAFTLMILAVGVFANTLALAGFSVRHDHATQGLIVTMAAVSITATSGLRDVPVIYGLPLLSLPFVLTCHGAGPAQVVNHLTYPVAMLVVACIVAELLYRGNVAGFMAAWRLRQSAMTDPLTGLLNRRAMSEELNIAGARAARHGQVYVLIMADLDHFKRVNDEHGHDVGDEVLVDLSRRLQSSVRLEDRVARWGGEEFLLLIQDADEEGACRIAEKLRRAVAETPFSTSAGALGISISLGLALSRGKTPIEEVITRADQALYRAKQDGRNRFAIAPSA